MAWNEPGGGGRDPWNPGGRRPGNGGNVPAVDEVLERLKARFKGKGGGSGGLSSGGAGLLAAALVALWVLSGIYTVDAQERAVVLRFGAYVAEAGVCFVISSRATAARCHSPIGPTTWMAFRPLNAPGLA